jgi:Alginate lyase
MNTLKSILSRIMFSARTPRNCLRSLCAAFLLAAVTAVAAPSALNLAKIDHDRILRDAAAALKQAPITITKYHARLSEGGPHEYYSNGDYWWPNPNTTNGLPYVRHDGESNPNNFDKHRECIWQLKDAVTALGAAYKITGDDRYVKKAVQLLQVFFLDPKTRMNPNLKYAQAIPGVSEGRGIGIIDTLHLIGIPKAIEVMDQSPTFPPEVLAGLKKWFADYVHWMLTSQNGHDEANTKNNHAVAFWLQVAVFSQFTGEETNLAECRHRFKTVFVPKQMAPNGSFPRELARTKPYGYSIFQLDNMATLCQVLSTTNDDLWKFTLPDGRGMKKAMAFLYPYLADKSKWLADGHHKDVQAWNSWPAREPSLLFAGLAYHNQNYLNLWEKLPADPTNQEVLRNIAIRQPILWVK